MGLLFLQESMNEWSGATCYPFNLYPIPAQPYPKSASPDHMFSSILILPQPTEFMVGMGARCANCKEQKSKQEGGMYIFCGPMVPVADLKKYLNRTQLHNIIEE
jgi:hypothetical protein